MDNASRLAAALAYYIIFSMAPLLVIGIALTGMVLGREATQDRLVGQIARYVNSQELAALIQTMIRNAGAPATNLFWTIVGIVVLFYAASSVFGELKDALNLIWDVPPKPPGGLVRFLVNRLLMVGMVIVSGFLLFLSLVADTVMAAATTWLKVGWPIIGTFGQGVSFIFFFAITLGVFALVYKYVPDIRVAWQDVWIGAVATTLLFSISRLLIGWYLGRTTVASTYGAAGSLGALLLWIFFSTQLFFLGAEFTQVYGRTYGSRWREHLLLVEVVPEAASLTEEVTELQPQQDVGLDPTIVSERVEVRQRRNFIRPLATLAVATGVIAAISIFNLIRAPFRK